MIYESFHKWQEVPTITSTDVKATLVTDISFPAVTICMESKNDESKFNFHETLKELMNYPENVSSQK